MSIQQIIEAAERFEFSKEDEERAERGRLAFVERFPEESLKDMQIEEYPQGNGAKDTFCYWLDFKKIADRKILFEISGHATKCGLFRFNDGKLKDSSGEYLSKSGAATLFTQIIEEITKALSYTKSNRIELIGEFAHSIRSRVLLKILAIYNPDKFITIGTLDAHKRLMEEFQITDIEVCEENLFRINHAIKSKIDSLDVFKGWHYEKLGTFLWKYYKGKLETNSYACYYAWVSETTDRLFEKALSFQVDDEDEENKINSIQIGNRIVVYDIDNEDEERPITILNKAYVVIENPNDGKTLKVEEIELAVSTVPYLFLEEYFLATIDSRFENRLVFNTEIMGQQESFIMFLFFLRKKYNLDIDLKVLLHFVLSICNSLQLNGIQIDDSRLAFVLRKDRFGLNIGRRNFLMFRTTGTYDILLSSSKEGGYYSERYRNGLYHNFYNIDEFMELSTDYIAQSFGDSINLAPNLTDDSHRGFIDAMIYVMEYHREKLLNIEDNVITEEEQKEKKQNQSHKTTHPLNQILYGPPGTGKTYNSVKIAAEIIKGKKFGKEEYATARAIFQEHISKKFDDDSKQIEFVTFHQNFSYEDFIQGLRPDTDSGKGNLSFQKVDGVFKRIADRAGENPYRNFVIVIDEINRANISRVFGELITLIEEDKRIGNEMEMYATLPSGDRFGVPNNLYILGTMNTADKSLALIDIALRRRFEFVAMYPDSGLIDNKEAGDILQSLNKKIIEKKNRDFQIGHSYFMNGAAKDIPETMNKKVIPLLFEYFNNDAKAVEDVVKEGIKDKYKVVTDDSMIPVKVEKK
jgi:hypothetical protein